MHQLDLIENESDAVLSPCRKYRYQLTRQWADGGTTTWIMLNPSTADENEDDPTIRRCRGFTSSWGHGRLIVVNLYALRATDPKDLFANRAVAVGHDNDDHIVNACAHADLIVCAWGAQIWTKDRADAVQRMMARYVDRPVHVLRLTKNGAPSHPLYLPKTLEPVLWQYNST